MRIKRDSWIVYGAGLLIFVSLLARDLMGIAINKYIFLFWAMLPIFFVQLENVLFFSFFMIPLFVGLPGNLISVFLLMRLLYETFRHRIKISGKGFFLTYMVVAYILVQNYATGHMQIHNIMAALDFINLFLLLSAIQQYDRTKQAIIAFSVGNFVLGLVMLCATLRYYSIFELMNPATRLGYTGMLLDNSGANMATSIDPNFYAMNVIATIATGCLLLIQPMSGLNKFVLLSAMIGCVIFCLIGLSRTFIVLLVLWGVLWLISQGNIKRTLTFIIVGFIVIFAFFQFMPLVASGLLERFSGSDVSGGNGRIELILKYYRPWAENIFSILFGIGLFNCYTHCAPLLYLFGLGVVGMLPLFAWFVHFENCCRRYVSRATFKEYIPAIVTFIGYSTIPAAGAINYTLPIVVAISAVMIGGRKRDNF